MDTERNEIDDILEGCREKDEGLSAVRESYDQVAEKCRGTLDALGAALWPLSEVGISLVQGKHVYVSPEQWAPLWCSAAARWGSFPGLGVIDESAWSSAGPRIGARVFKAAAGGEVADVVELLERAQERLEEWDDVDEVDPLAVGPHVSPEDTYVGVWAFLRDIAVALEESVEAFRARLEADGSAGFEFALEASADGAKAKAPAARRDAPAAFEFNREGRWFQALGEDRVLLGDSEFGILGDLVDKGSCVGKYLEKYVARPDVVIRRLKEKSPFLAKAIVSPGKGRARPYHFDPDRGSEA